MPRIYFEMTGIDYDSARKTPATQKYKAIIPDGGSDANAKEVRTQYVPVPYNISFEVGILAKSQDDGLQILEQILPFFQPSFTMSLKFIPDMNEKRDVSIILNNINELEQHLKELLINNQLRIKLGNTAKQRAINELQWDKIKEEYFSLISMVSKA